MASIILPLALSKRMMLLCLPMISITRVTATLSPISFLLETLISKILSFSTCWIASMTAPCRYLRITMIKVLGTAGFSNVVSVNWTRPKTEWADRSSLWLLRLLRICKTSSCSKGWLIFWMRPPTNSWRSSSVMWCKKNPSKDMLFSLKVTIENYNKKPR